MRALLPVAALFVGKLIIDEVVRLLQAEEDAMRDPPDRVVAAKRREVPRREERLVSVQRLGHAPSARVLKTRKRSHSEGPRRSSPNGSVPSTSHCEAAGAEALASVTSG